MHDLRTLVGKLSPQTRKALERSAGLCLSLKHYDVTIEHLLMVLLGGESGGTAPEAASALEIDVCLRQFGVSPEVARHELQAALDRMRTGNTRAPALSPDLVVLLTEALLASSLVLGQDRITSGALLLAMLGERLAPLLLPACPEILKIPVEQLRTQLPDLVRQAGESLPAPQRSATAGLKVFLSYRRSDADSMAEIMFWCLMAKFEGIRLFRDKDTLQPGMVFADVIDQNIANCDIVLVLIGNGWLNAVDQSGGLRLHDESDWVRLEVASAMRQKKRIFPCLIDGAAMPRDADLPPDLQGLGRFHAMSISLGEVSRDVDRLIKAMQS